MNLNGVSMPTKRPRLTVTLTPRTSKALTGAARVMRTSRGAIVLDMLTEAAPMLEQLAMAAQAIKRASPASLEALAGRKDQLLATLGALRQSADGTASAALSSLDLFAGEVSTRDVPSPPSATQERKSETVRSRAVNPPPVNKGGETQTTKVVRIGKGRAK